MKKYIFAIIVLIGIVGLDTGFNYYLLNKNFDYSKCFIFGLCALANSENFLKIAAESVVSATKYFLMLYCGVIPLLLPITFVTLFSVNFKMGAVLGSIVSTLKFSGITEIIFIFALCMLIVAVTSVSTYLLVKQAVFHYEVPHWSNTDTELFIKVFIGFVIFVILILFLLFICKNTNNYIVGFLK